MAAWMILQLVALVSVADLSTGQTNQCYVCTSDFGTGCGIPFSASGSYVTTESCNSCYTISTSGSIIGTSYTRGCNVAGLSNGCVTAGSQKVCTSTCSTNLCNTGSGAMPAVRYSIFALLACTLILAISTTLLAAY